MESESVYTKQQRIAELARQMPDAGFTSLAYHIDLEWLKEAYGRTRKDGATGVDDMTAARSSRRIWKIICPRCWSGSSQGVTLHHR